MPFNNSCDLKTVFEVPEQDQIISLSQTAQSGTQLLAGTPELEGRSAQIHTSGQKVMYEPAGNRCVPALGPDIASYLFQIVLCPTREPQFEHC